MSSRIRSAARLIRSLAEPTGEHRVRWMRGRHPFLPTPNAIWRPNRDVNCRLICLCHSLKHTHTNSCVCVVCVFNDWGQIGFSFEFGFGFWVLRFRFCVLGFTIYDLGPIVVGISSIANQQLNRDIVCWRARAPIVGACSQAKRFRFRARGLSNSELGTRNSELGRADQAN